jgi:CRP-like cAMP-binding protein
MQRSLALIVKDKPARVGANPALPPGFRVRLFEGLTPSEINAVLAAARPGRISAGQIIRHEGDLATHLFLLVTGHAVHYTVTDAGEKVFLRWIAPGDVFGMQVLERESADHLTTIEAVQKGSVLMWERGSARALFLRYPRILDNAYTSVLDSVASVIGKLAVRAGQTAQQRLARILVSSAEQIGRAGRNGVELDLTNEQLADLTGVSPFTVSRQLSEWQRQGILARRRGKIVLRSPERLVSQHF